MADNKAKLIIFTGPSGVGKGTILKEYFNQNKNTKIVYSVSNTTRAPRTGEENGVHYFFITKEEFEDLIKKDSFLEWASYSGNYYGTNKNFVKDKLSQGYSVLLEIELQGALQVMEKCPDALSIFIVPPDFDELKRRLIGRHTEDDSAIKKRLEAAKAELSNKDKFKYVIKNDTIENAVGELNNIFQKELGL